MLGILKGDELSGAPSTSWRRCFVALVVLQLVAVVFTLENFPVTPFAPLVAAGFLTLLNLLVLATAPHPWNWVLQVCALVLIASSLLLTFNREFWFSLESRAIAMVTCTLLVVGFAWFRVPSPPLRVCLLALQLALAVTLLSWLATEPIRISGELEVRMARQHFHAGMRALFAAPLILGSVAALGSLSRLKSQAIALGSVCAGQLGIGCMELGNAIGSDTVSILGVVAGLSMIPLLLLARARKRHEDDANLLGSI